MFIQHVTDSNPTELQLNIDQITVQEEERELIYPKTTIQEYIQNYINEQAPDFRGGSVKLLAGNVVIAEVILRPT